ncbi:hypothetical protein CERSUDRAFT_97023 [Gelatoporia subvermispora B]|uniref:Uncharacterized protein n=1 Tax=Ceriporiopsis subvermispora (strain B) TaxID=914234 RepID=M2R9I6_CERS8|nr:hypothetical protein CERSUDRAFT_97023 [Gelatoporia subvermispora B]
MASIPQHPIVITVQCSAPAPKRSAPSLTKGQRIEIAQRSRDAAARLEGDLTRWYDNSVAYLEELSRCYGKKSDHYLRLMFMGATKTRTARKPNAFNAWGHKLAQEAAAEGHGGADLIDLEKENLPDYHDLTAEEKMELINTFTDDRKSYKFKTRTNQRDRTHNIQNVVKKVDALLFNLKRRVGVEYVLCIVRNTDEYPMNPHWCFSNEAINEYLKGTVRKGWDTQKISALMEAFAVASCDMVSMFNTSQARANWYKGQIRDKINALLAEASDHPGAIMNYITFERDIVLRYSIDLKGWPLEKFVNPSELSTSIPPLLSLKEALDNGTCHFVKLNAVQLAEREEKYRAALESGTEQPRKKRKDAGKSRGRRSGQQDDGTHEPDGGQPSKRRKTQHKSAEIVPDDDS